MAGHQQAAATGPPRRAWALVAVFAVVIVTDQAAKWWVWRNFDPTLINSGGYILLGPLRSWFTSPAADVIGGVLLIAGVRWLLGRQRPLPPVIGGGLIAAGFTSNILDRLGLHRLTAPGSARGVVDFIPDGTPGRSNVADVWIAAGALLLGYAVARRRIGGPQAGTGNQMRARVVDVVAVLLLTGLAVASSLDRGGVYRPTR